MHRTVVRPTCSAPPRGSFTCRGHLISRASRTQHRPSADMLRIVTAPDTLLGYLDRVWPPH
ncbi:hypothetical protein, partial [Nocardia cyriacigeorgica]|uniref:hypothetical protein n=1 Tax=Nocardia cyriacigeorgica TaxID=135487 RepID=UPI002455B13E